MTKDTIVGMPERLSKDYVQSAINWNFFNKVKPTPKDLCTDIEAAVRAKFEPILAAKDAEIAQLQIELQNCHEAWVCANDGASKVPTLNAEITRLMEALEKISKIDAARSFMNHCAYEARRIAEEALNLKETE